MAKKKSKQQPKQPNEANLDDAATVPTTSVTTTSQSASTSRDDVYATTQILFFDFITLATMEDIKRFLKLASTTPEGENLGTLWRRAHGEGYEKGRKSLLQDLEKKMEEKFEEGVERGMNLSREEGYTVAKEAFDDIIKVVKAREAPKVDTIDASSQTDTPATASNSTQTDPANSIFGHIGTQTSKVVSENTNTTTTVDMSVQTNPRDTILGATTVHFVTPSSCHIIHPSPSQASSALTPTIISKLWKFM